MCPLQCENGRSDKRGEEKDSACRQQSAKIWVLIRTLSGKELRIDIGSYAMFGTILRQTLQSYTLPRCHIATGQRRMFWQGFRAEASSG